MYSTDRWYLIYFVIDFNISLYTCVYIYTCISTCVYTYTFYGYICINAVHHAIYTVTCKLCYIFLTVSNCLHTIYINLSAICANYARSYGLYKTY